MEFISTIRIWLLRIIKQPLLWAFLVMAGLELITYYFFKNKATVLASVSTGLVVMFGYFATHFLTIARKQKEEKFNRCLELIKKIRFFILEANYKGTPQQSKMRDELQDAYFAFSLLTSEKSYKALSEMMNKFKACINDPTNYLHSRKLKAIS